MQFAEGVGEGCLCQFAISDGVGADDVQRVSVVSDKTEHSIRLLRGEALVFFDSHQIAQILQRQQYECVGALGYQPTILLLPFRCETDILHVVAGILLTEGSVFQLRDKLVEFLARVPLFVPFRIDNCF